MAEITISAKSREISTKSAVNQMRKDGIINVKSDLNMKSVQVKFNSQKISIKDIKDCFVDFEHQRVINSNYKLK